MDLDSLQIDFGGAPDGGDGNGVPLENPEAEEIPEIKSPLDE